MNPHLARALEVLERVQSIASEKVVLVNLRVVLGRVLHVVYECAKVNRLATEFSGAARRRGNGSMRVPIKPHPHHLRHSYCISAKGPPIEHMLQWAAMIGQFIHCVALTGLLLMTDQCCVGYWEQLVSVWCR
jgi:hypothetical protein